ncbi:MAG: hypothetical protein OEM52_09380 [bacterium]|nr:hypothetical protein [bacterium]
MHIATKRIYLGLFVLLSLATVGWAQVSTDIEPPQPRLAAIGATVALAGDPAMAFINPAGLITLKNPSGGFAFTKPYGVGFMNLYGAAGAYPLPKEWGVASIAVLNSGVSYRGESLSNETALSLAHAFYMQRDMNTDLAFGYALKVMSQSFGMSINGTSLGSATVVGLDAGVRATLWQRTRIGMRVSNLNHPTLSGVVEHDLPTVVNAGVAYSPYRGVLTAIELERTLGQEQLLKGGVELEVDRHLDLRMGIRSNPNRIALGFGVKNILGFRVDYTYLTHPSLPATHLFGLGYGY